MSTPPVTSVAPEDAATPAVVRLVDTAGDDGPATPGQVAEHLQAGQFFWLDLEDPSDDDLTKFSQSLRLPAGSVAGVFHASQRSSFAPTVDSVQAVLPAAVDTESTAWLDANYVTVVLTEQFLFTVHNGPCPPILHTRRQSCSACYCPSAAPSSPCCSSTGCSDASGCPAQTVANDRPQLSAARTRNRVNSLAHRGRIHPST